MRRNIGFVIIFVGFLVLCIPQISVMVYNYKQKELEKEWELSMSALAPLSPSQVQAAQPEGVAGLSEEAPEEEKTENLPQEEEESALQSNQTKAMKNAIGMLKIDSIHLKVPILQGTTSANLNIARTTIEPTGQPGKIGNMAIAGHNNYEYGRNFNRLSEVVVGDKIEVHTQTGVITYQVVEVFYVDPDQTWVLQGEKEKSLITLITCYPRNTATKRLIVRGELLPSVDETGQQ